MKRKILRPRDLLVRFAVMYVVLLIVGTALMLMMGGVR